MRNLPLLAFARSPCSPRWSSNDGRCERSTSITHGHSGVESSRSAVQAVQLELSPRPSVDDPLQVEQASEQELEADGDRFRRALTD